MTRAVILDYYGTLARATHWVSFEDVLAEHGYQLGPETRNRWFNDGIDGIEHVEPSRSRDHYVAWQRDRMLAMLAESDVHPGEYDEIVGKLRRGTATRVLETYDEVPGVLGELRDRGLRVAVCSNWDWDLDDALDEVGLGGAFDVVVSSAWVGARKPHPRIFAETLARVGVAAADTVFVGDSWVPDVEGPAAAGMRCFYLERNSHWPDLGAPRTRAERARAAHLIGDLTGVVDAL